MFLDIIIPQYNEDEKVIFPLLDALNNQVNVDFNDIKITIVNDCSSTILSKVFLDSFSNLNISYLTNEKNTGPGLARQFGVDHSSSKYITFIDSDDTLDSLTVLGEVINYLKTNEVKYLVTNIKVEVIKNKKLDFIIKSKEDTFPWMHGKFYSREFLSKNNIRFHPSIRHLEDSYFTTCVLGMLKESEVRYLDVTTVIWKLNTNSLTRSLKPKEYTLNTFEEFYKTYKYGYDFLVKSKSYLRFSYLVSSIFGIYIALNSSIFDGISNKIYLDKLNDDIIKKKNIFFLFEESNLQYLFNHELRQLVDRLGIEKVYKEFNEFKKEYLL